MKTVVLSLLLLFLFGNNSLPTTPKLNFEKLKSMPRPAYGMSYMSDGEYIFSIGGGSKFLSETNDIFAYHITSDEWITLPSNEEIKPFNSGWGEYLVDNQEIIFMGGYNHGIRSHGEITKNLAENIYKFDFKTKHLQVLHPNVHQAVDAGVAVLENRLYTFGGSVPFKNTRARVDYTDAFHEYNVASGEWFELPKMPVAKITKGRIVNDVLYTFGGRKRNPQKDIHQFDFTKKEWQKIGSLKKGISNFAITQYKDKIILVGDARIPNTLHVFDTQTKKIQSFKTNHFGANSGAVVVEGKLYIFGGISRSGISHTLHVLDLTKMVMFD